MGGKASALGRTNGGGAVDAGTAIASFMGGASGAGAAPAAGAATGAGAGAGTGAKASTGAGAAAGAGSGSATGAGAATAGAATTKRQNTKGTKTPKGTKENAVAASAGAGASSGLPTTADDGTITMTFHQVNQDGAGPLTADVDATSGGTDPSAFKSAKVTQNVPGIGIAGLSAATTTDFPVKVQMPQGMTCSGTAGGVSNVCIVRMQNSALAGPFGGSAAFTQSAAAKKRAVEYNLRKRHMARGILGKPE
ncbi:hypothetical protein PMIN06_009227 [Paraphaeosphaeria minitans]